MAEKYYLDKVGLQDVAGHVNTRLKTVTTIPVSADDGAVRLYVGETGATYKKGHIYQYNATDLEWVDITGSTEYTAGNGIDIDNGEISVETYIFTGTQLEWDALTTEQKQEYQICNITDDGSADEAIYTKAEIDAMLGTAASKDYTDTVRPNDHDLVESNAVYAAINNAVSSIYTPRGDLTCAELTSALLIEANVGNVYQMSDSGTTSALFINGAGHTISVNDNVGIIKAGADTYMFNLMGNAFDLHDYQKQDLSTPIIIGGTSRTTVESALSALNDVDATKMSYSDNSILGAKNLIPYPYYQSQRETNGITYTSDINGVVTANGTATADALIAIAYHIDASDFNGYILNGCPSGGSNDTYHIYMCATAYPYTHYADDYGSGAVINCPTSTDGQIVIRIRSGVTVDNLKFYPMIRLATDTDSIFQPHSMTNQQITPYVQAISNPNLIDNPWFTVNQRGGSSYANDWVYTVDRWLKGESYTLSVGNNGISASVINIDHGHLSQRLDIYNNLVGKTCTLSILKSTGEISSATGVVLSGVGTSMAISDNDIWCALVKDANFDFIALNFKNTTTTVRAVKLELGSVSTLAMDTIPNYVSELLKCQRYFVRYDASLSSAANIGFAFAEDTSTLSAQVNLPVFMRSVPAVTFAGLSVWKNSGKAIENITGIRLSGNVVRMALTLTGQSTFTAGEMFCVYFSGSSDRYIDFSADL